MFISTISLFAAIALISQDKAELDIHHVSARYMYTMLKHPGGLGSEGTKTDKQSRGLLPEGVEIAVTNGSNSLTAVGSKASIDEVRRIIAMFDIKPKSIDIDFIATAPALDRDFRTESTVINNTSLFYKDPTSDSEFSITPRINGDRTITILIKGGTLGHYINFVARVPHGQVIYGLLLPKKVTDEKTGITKNVMTFQYTTLAIDAVKFLSAEDPRVLSSDWLYFKDIQASDGSLSGEPPAEAELRFILSTRIR